MIRTASRAFPFSLAVVASLAVPALGLLLVFACLIAPALWAKAGSRLPVGIAVTAVAAACGLLASWVFDAPSGACVALALALSGVASIALAGPRLSARESSE